MEQEVSESIFHEIADVGIDPVFGLDEMFRKDPRKHKISLLAGVCLEENGGPPKIYKAVRMAEKEILDSETTKNYLPIDGDPEYVHETGKMIFGDMFKDHIYCAQTQGGTSALNIACELLKNNVASGVCASSPTWANHAQIFKRVGISFDYYPYWNGEGFSFEKMLDYMEELPSKTAILLQAMCHNPTGHDLSFDEWVALSKLMHRKKLIPFFDTAYQGFGLGIKHDAQPIRFMMEEGHEMIVTHSFSKSMGLYAERVGALFVVMKNQEMKERIARLIKSIIRTDYSNPSKHGSSIAKTILQSPKLREIWEEELESIRLRIRHSRTLFADKLSKRFPSKSYDYIRSGNGFFCLLGLSKEQVETLREKHGIYMTSASRVNLAAIHQKNVDVIVDALAQSD